jgi:GDP-L-fucose synthase
MESDPFYFLKFKDLTPDPIHAKNSHVIPALMRRIHEAKLNHQKSVTIWGSGKPMREFLHVDDMASASLYVMNLEAATYQQHTQAMLSHINVGTGIDCSIRELAETIAKVLGFNGSLEFDAMKPDGTMRKLMDISRLKSLGWEASISLEQGLTSTYAWFLEHLQTFRK